MHIEPNRLFKADTPNVFVILDAETEYALDVHDRYLAAERVKPEDIPTRTASDPKQDPRLTPRWAAQRINTLSWLVMIDGSDGLRPVRMETRGAPEHDEGAIVASFFKDMASHSALTIVTYNGFRSDVPRILLAAAAAGLRLPASLAKLHAPWPRGRHGHLDLMSEICGGADRVHLAELAAKLDIPAKLTCHPERIHELMERGKWSAVKAVAEGDVLTTALLLMRWRHLVGGSTSALESTLRLTRFVADHLSHRPYAADWMQYGARILRDVMTSQTLERAPARLEEE